MTRARTLLVRLAVTSAPILLIAGEQAVASPRPQPQAEPPITVPMELLVNRPMVRVKINGQGPFALLIDPEAPQTLIDQNLATELKLAPQHDRTVGPTFDLQMEFGSAKPRNVSVRPTDMARVAPEFGPATRPRGILSASLWPSHLVTLDYPRYQLRVESGSLPDPNRRDVFSLTAGSRDFGVTLVIGSLVISCQLDPLSPGGLQLPEGYVKSLPLASKLTETGSTVTAKGRVVIREARIAADAALGMFEFSQPLVQFVDSGEGCTIGGQRLTDFSITYDAANARVRLAPQGAR